ncbi:VWA domain-containing protein [Streptomyces sp. NBC_01537]|uniref:vWA domain-containing protein n=1 Tax=Streptomyces sp. NBC_01537 TaxID=2903896 RepID=UPI0038661119
MADSAVGIEMDVAGPTGVRHLPVYLLLDCSWSMDGEPIEAVRRGLEIFDREAKGDEFSAKTVRVGVITFGRVLEVGKKDGALLVTKNSEGAPGLVSIEDFVPPQLKAEGTTPLGAALRELNKSIDNDVAPRVVGKQKGDWKPLIFILTDGQPTDAEGNPTDDWKKPRQQVLARESKRLINLVTVGCGRSIDRETLREICMGDTYVLDEKDNEHFSAYFRWMTQSVGAVARTVSIPGGGDRRVVDLPPAPAQVKQLSF